MKDMLDNPLEGKGIDRDEWMYLMKQEQAKFNLLMDELNKQYLQDYPTELPIPDTEFCTCACHSNPDIKHIVACCNNGIKIKR